jgi:hypothetical protein
MDGHEFLRKVLSKGAFARYIIITGSDSENEVAALSGRNDVIAVFRKDQLDISHLRDSLAEARKELEKAKTDYQKLKRYESMLQDSPEAVQIDRQAVYYELISGISPEREWLRLICPNPAEPAFRIALAEPAKNVDSDFSFLLHNEAVKSLQHEIRSQSYRYEGIDILIVGDQKLCVVIAPPPPPRTLILRLPDLKPSKVCSSNLTGWSNGWICPDWRLSFTTRPSGCRNLPKPTGG